VPPTIAVDTRFTGSARAAATAAIGRVGEDVDAGVATADAAYASVGALTGRTDLALVADVAASATVCQVERGIDALAIAVDQARAAALFAGAVEADSTVRARLAAGATVLRIEAEVDASVGAAAAATRALDSALTPRAHFASCAFLCATTAVGWIPIEVDAARAAFRRTAQARSRALTCRAQLADPTHFVTSTTVLRIEPLVDAAPRALRKIAVASRLRRSRAGRAFPARLAWSTAHARRVVSARTARGRLSGAAACAGVRARVCAGGRGLMRLPACREEKQAPKQDGPSAPNPS
jgi:hypothetical protein